MGANGPWRKVYVRMWRRGGSFSKLSGPPRPCAQHLWFYLLTGDGTTPLPGVMVFDEAMIAARLGWSGMLEELRSVCDEIEREEMAAFDRDAGLAWCPAALEYNRPLNPNVLIAWGRAYDVLPESPVKRQVYQGVQALVAELTQEAEARQSGNPQAFAEAFRRSFPQAAPAAKKKAAKPKAKKPRIVNVPGFERVWFAYPNKNAMPAASRSWKAAARDGRIVAEPTPAGEKRHDAEITVDALVAHIEERARLDRQWIRDGGEFVPHLSRFLADSRWRDAWKVDRTRQTQHVGEQQPTQPIDEERRQAVKGILSFGQQLLELETPPESVRALIRRFAKVTRKLCDDPALSRPELLRQFYDQHEKFCAAAFEALPEELRQTLDDGRPEKADIAAWRRKRLCEQCGFPNALDVDPMEE